jgi:serine/threonine protein kinase
MAPEVLNKCRYSYQADFFAVGIIMYRLIMGKMPYQNRQDKVLLRREMLENQIEIDYKTID